VKPVAGRWPGFAELVVDWFGFGLGRSPGFVVVAFSSAVDFVGLGPVDFVDYFGFGFSFAVDFVELGLVDFVDFVGSAVGFDWLVAKFVAGALGRSDDFAGFVVGRVVGRCGPGLVDFVGSAVGFDWLVAKLVDRFDGPFAKHVVDSLGRYADLPGFVVGRVAGRCGLGLVVAGDFVGFVVGRVADRCGLAVVVAGDFVGFVVAHVVDHPWLFVLVVVWRFLVLVLVLFVLAEFVVCVASW